MLTEDQIRDRELLPHGRGLKSMIDDLIYG